MPSGTSWRKPRSAPHWAIEAFRNFIEESERLFHVVRLSSIGIGMIQVTPKAIEALMKVQSAEINKESDRLKRAEEDAELATREVQSGFPMLYSWAIVGSWALLEAAIRNFIAEWLKHKRTAWRAEPIRRLRVRIGDYESIPRNQRYGFIVEMLERETDAGLKEGLTRFEALLDPFELSGEVHPELRQQMYEFSQVRNLITHNVGRVDRRFAKACPWLKTKVGEELYVSHEMFVKYHSASIKYATIIICRIGEYFGADMSDELLAITSTFET